MSTDPTTRATLYTNVRPTEGRGLAIATAAAILLGVPVALWAGGTVRMPLQAGLVVAALALLVAPDRHAPLGPASVVTLVRAVLTAWVIGFVGQPVAATHAGALWFAAGFAFFLDAVDGRVARSTGTASPEGARLDMELDGLTVFGLTALLWWLDRAGPWVMLAGLWRYLWIGASLVLPWMNRPLFPSSRRPWACGIHLLCTIFAILPWSMGWIGPTLALVGFLAVTASFAIDFAWLVAHRDAPLRQGAPES